MELTQIRQFLALANTLHFGRAAQELGMAQPHLSRAVARLEEEIGVRLFERTSRRVTLTAGGERFRDEAVAILQAETRARAAAREAMEVARRRIRIAFVSAALHQVLPDAIRSLRRAPRPLDIVLREATTNEQVGLIAAGDIDLGLGHPPVESHARLRAETLFEDRFDVVIPADHRFADRRSLPFAAIAAESMVLFPEEQGPVLYAAIRDQCRRAGATLTVTATATRLHSQLSLVAAGLGIGLAPIQSRSLRIAGTVRLPLVPAPASLVLPLAMLWDPRSHNASLPVVLNTLRAAAGRKTEGG